MTQHKCADCAYFRQGKVIKYPNPDPEKKRTWVDCVLGCRINDKTNACPNFRESETCKK